MQHARGGRMEGTPAQEVAARTWWCSPWQLAALWRLLKACRKSKAPGEGCTLCRSPGGQYRVEDVICLRQTSLLLHWGQRPTLLARSDKRLMGRHRRRLAGTGMLSMMEAGPLPVVRWKQDWCTGPVTSQQNLTLRTCLHLPPVWPRWASNTRTRAGDRCS